MTWPHSLDRGVDRGVDRGLDRGVDRGVDRPTYLLHDVAPLLHGHGAPAPLVAGLKSLQQRRLHVTVFISRQQGVMGMGEGRAGTGRAVCAHVCVG